MMKKPTVVDLFAGAGGMSEGFRQAGYQALLAVECDEMAAKTFSFNHPDVPVYVGDIRDLSLDDVIALSGPAIRGGVDILCGGPPCQGFSIAGQRFADDPRNTLFLEFVRLVRALRPRFFVFENVAGIRSMLGGAVLQAIIREFTGAGYTCSFRILNAADYGVPQARPRFIMIGGLDGISPGMPEETHASSAGGDLFGLAKLQHITVWDALSDLPLIEAGEGDEVTGHVSSPVNPYQAERRGRRHSGVLFNHRATGHSEIIKARYRMIPEGGNNSEVPVELRTKKVNVFKLHRFKPSRTVTCNHRTDLLHPTVPRGTTVREAARLQSFDDDYRFFGNLTRKAKWVTQDDQVGNAVPPLLAKAIGEHLAKVGEFCTENEDRHAAE